MNWSLDGIDPDPIYKKSRDPHSGRVQSGQELREILAEQGRPVIVAFSRGKDSICAAIALKAAGVETRLVHLFRTPGLKFEEDSLKYFEDFFQEKIWNVPHPDFWHYLVNGVFMAPWQNSICEAALLEEVSHPENWHNIRAGLGVDPDTWVADGIRAADSPMRRMSIQTHGPWKHNIYTTEEGEEWHDAMAHVIHDWKIADIRHCLKINRVKLPVDYDMFDRTYDGNDYRFIKPISEWFPEDYEAIRFWFPAVDLEMMRYEQL